MIDAASRLLVDCSVVAKWKLTSEPHAAQARELLLDWRDGAVLVAVPDQLFSELVNSMLGACRKYPPRLTVAQARDALRELLASPFTVYRTIGKGILTRAFEIAYPNNQRAYDCLYVALAERKRLEFWTGDQRLFNALHSHFPFIRWIAHYQRRRP